MLCNFSATALMPERPQQNAFVTFNLVVRANSQTTSVLRIRRSSYSKVELRHVENLGKNRFRSLAGPGLSCRFICAICAGRRFAGNGKCGYQRHSAGPGKRWRNEQCGGRSQRRGQRIQNGATAAAAHIRPDNSEVQVTRKGLATHTVAAGVGGKWWPWNPRAAAPL